MKKYFKSQWLWIVSLLLIAMPQSGLTKTLVQDATGQTVVIEESPRRIITLAPSLGELVADLLDEDLSRIIGVSDFTDYPPALTKKVSVGAYDRLDIEQIVSLRPDLILATRDGNASETISHLRALHVPVVVVRTGSLAEVVESVRLVAQALGAEKRGQWIAQQLELGFSRFRERAQARKSHIPSVLIQVGADPLIVAGGGSILSEVLSLLGARNTYADISMGYPRPAQEDVVRRNPAWILVIALGKEMRPFEKMASDWKKYHGLKAVGDGHVLAIRADELLRPSPRLLEGLSKLEKLLFHAK